MRVYLFFQERKQHKHTVCINKSKAEMQLEYLCTKIRTSFDFCAKMPRKPKVARAARVALPQVNSDSSDGKISSTARTPTVCCSVLNAFAAASRTSASSSHSASCDKEYTQSVKSKVATKTPDAGKREVNSKYQ